jgi:Beta-lactamase
MGRTINVDPAYGTRERVSEHKTWKQAARKVQIVRPTCFEVRSPGGNAIRQLIAEHLRSHSSIAPEGFFVRNYICLPLVFFATVLCSAQNVAASRACQLPPNQIGTMDLSVRDLMEQYAIKAIIVQVRCGGADVRTLALGQSMTGVPATPDMHFRNGAMAFTYMSTMLLEPVDQGKVNLDDKLSRFYPDLPEADHITLRNLATMTSGYADYVYEPEVLHGIKLNPFRHWTSQELIHIGISKPMMFQPGTNFGYSHTKYVILGGVLEKITGMPWRRRCSTSSLPWVWSRRKASIRPKFPLPFCIPSAPNVAPTLLFPPEYFSTKRQHSGFPHGPLPAEESRSLTSPNGAGQWRRLAPASSSLNHHGKRKLVQTWSASVTPILHVRFAGRTPPRSITVWAL